MLNVEDVTLGYGTQTIVHAATLALARGEIGCLLGASGCGKTTLLRAIAGFERVRSGSIRLHERILSDALRGQHVPTQKRDVGMVFQDHALFPHLRVGDNVAFGLRGHSADAQRARVQEMLELVGLGGMQRRWPHELSGGQQQRVALARALAPAPEVLLMDEPFSSLDAAMRESLAHEVRTILKRSQTTALMVTHDQAEAFAIADRIGVMAAGRLQQWDSAQAIYERPATRFVAEFVGEGAFLAAHHDDEGWRCALGTLPRSHPHYPHCPRASAHEGGLQAGWTRPSSAHASPANAAPFARTAQVAPIAPHDQPDCLSQRSPAHDEPMADVLLRPEQLRLLPAAPAASTGAWAHIERSVFRGSHFAHTLRLDDGQTLLAHTPLTQPHPTGARVWVGLV